MTRVRWATADVMGVIVSTQMPSVLALSWLVKPATVLLAFAVFV
jgi:hypothetical protein